MAWYDDLPDWFRPRGVGTGAGVARGASLPPAMPGQRPPIPPPVTSPLSDITSTPAFQVGYPLLAAGLSAAFPVRGTRAVAGLSAGLNTANYYNQLQRQEQELQRQEEDRQQLRNKLADFLGSMQSTPRPEGTEGPLLESGAFGQAPTVPESPTKSLAQVLNEANQPAAAVKLLEAAMAKPPEHYFNVGDRGYKILPGQPEATPITPALPPRPTTPPRPVYQALGNEQVRSVYNPQLQQWEETRAPLTPLPKEPTPLHPLQEQNLQSLIAERNARRKRLDDAARTAKDPKANKEKLMTMYSGLSLDRDRLFESGGSKDDIANIDLILADLREGLARIAKESKGTGEPVLPPREGGAKAPPKVGEIRKGYRFKGGDPSNQASWEKVR